MSAGKILIVEDEETLLEVLRYNLDKEGYTVVTAADGIQALNSARSESPDLIILDIMLPQLDGFEVCRILRKDITVPILMLTAKEEEIDKVLGLELGADDYMAKPFSMRELKARIKAILRRAAMQSKPGGVEGGVLRIADLTIDLGKHQVSIGEATVSLTPKEFDLLAYLAGNKGRVFSREHLLERVWGYDYFGDTRTVDVHIRWLREKLETEPSKPRRLITVRGTGYKIEG
ncbi:response regulator transcription factor [Dehalococcoidia bacterium]|nr:response regulator transcription factor [Dehalococcoidia bacterium]MCL0048972.1 response regulator transcription factor [Dehalococcoidia bacterium]MCL0050433.1 response regulator transcription factor [Dehalococcoidia bacterium]MCL0082348.1 response regulator transcription factor [Dehalococcoidia bacterium]MCL0090653.1 response regulator transcription factor [Dehalococcoidia bacterium]